MQSNGGRDTLEEKQNNKTILNIEEIIFTILNVK